MADTNRLDLIWVADQTPAIGYRDVYVVLSYLAGQTKHVKLAPGVINPYTRNPVIAAHQSLTLEELAHSRTVFGIGPGGTLPLTPMAIPMWTRPIKIMRESLEFLRAFFSGKEVTMNGEFVKARKVKSFLGKVDIPIYVGARGPKLFRLAGELADGVYTNAPLATLRMVLEQIREGANRVRREPSTIGLASAVSAAISDDPEEARERLKVTLAWRVAYTPLSIIEQTNIKTSDYLTVRKAVEEKGESAASSLVSDQMIDNFAIAGDLEHCVKLCRRYIDSGATHLVFRSDAYEPLQGLKPICDELIPALRSETA
jgi:5,10-methylenetetrahydromethanopterin reductase